MADATPNSSKLAQILLQLKEVNGSDESTGTMGDNVLFMSGSSMEFDVITSNESDDAEVNVATETCNCRKSKCLKLYCQCFAGKAICNALCRCVACENNSDNATVRTEAIKMILERNPNAFDSKFKPTLNSSSVAAAVDPVVDISISSAVAHKNGCRCRKSMCLKKYCECFQAAVSCSGICTCLSCCNTPGSAHLSITARSSPLQQEDLVSAQPDANKSVDFPDRLSSSGKAVHAFPGQPAKQKVADATSIGSLDGFMSHMMGSIANKQLDQLSFSGSKPPLPPSGKRKRESQGEEGQSGTANGAPCTPSKGSLLRGTDQQSFLERQLCQELESGLLAGMFAQSAEQGAGEWGDNLSSSGSTSALPGRSIRSASPNSMSIATALSLFAANCFHHYNKSLTGGTAASGGGEQVLGSPLPGESPATLECSASALLRVGSVDASALSGATPQRYASMPLETPISGAADSSSAGKQSELSGCLDTSTTSEDTDESDLSQEGAVTTHSSAVSSRDTFAALQQQPIQMA